MTLDDSSGGFFPRRQRTKARFWSVLLNLLVVLAAGYLGYRFGKGQMSVSALVLWSQPVLVLCGAANWAAAYGLRLRVR